MVRPSPGGGRPFSRRATRSSSARSRAAISRIDPSRPVAPGRPMAASVHEARDAVKEAAGAAPRIATER